MEVAMISTRKLISLCGLLVFIVGLLTGCDALPFLEQDEGQDSYSGVVEAVEVAVSPQIGGRVAEVYASEGDPVNRGDLLFKLEDEPLTLQYEQAAAGLEAAKSNLESAQASYDLAEASLLAAQTAHELAIIQRQAALFQSRSGQLEGRQNAWDRLQPDEFETPAWYFSNLDENAAAQAEVDAAEQYLTDQLDVYHELIQGEDFTDLRQADQRLAEAQVRFLVAKSLRDREIADNGAEQLEDSLLDLFEEAQEELDAAQAALEDILAVETRVEILRARADVTTARERYETALDLWSSTLIGEQSLEVRAADLGIEQAQAAIMQAEAALAQAEAGLTAAQRAVDQAQAGMKIIELQIGELMVYSPESGVILVRSIEPGEVILPGSTAMTIGRLDDMTITLYVPEDRYGQIALGDSAEVTADSFPGEIFPAVVTRIADQAEYTPRNLGTEQDRSTIVFAVELSVADPDNRLKPGMLVDVSIIQR
jgi:multidrug resistance efflux pump